MGSLIRLDSILFEAICGESFFAGFVWR
jgi:3-methyladenine DNA glycosylase Tag